MIARIPAPIARALRVILAFAFLVAMLDLVWEGKGEGACEPPVVIEKK